MQGSVDLTAKDQRQPLSGTVLTLQSDWRVFSTFCLVSRNSTDKGLQEKKKKKKRRAPYPSCSGLFQVLYKGHRMVLHLPQEKEKERTVLPKLLNERSSSSDRYQALLFCLPARLSCGCHAWIRQLCSFPPAQMHTHSLFWESFLPISGPNTATILRLTLINSAPCLLTQKATVLQPAFFHFHSSCSYLGLLYSTLTALSYRFDLVSALGQWISKER